MSALTPKESADLAPKKDDPMERLVAPVVEGIEAMIRAELETRDYKRFARVVNLCNQAKAILNVARSPRVLADLDDEPAHGVTNAGNVVPFFPAPGPFAPMNQVAELLRAAAPITDALAAQARARAAAHRAEELQSLAESRATLAGFILPERLAEIDARIIELTKPPPEALPVVVPPQPLAGTPLNSPVVTGQGFVLTA